MATADELFDEADRLKEAGNLDEAVAKWNEALAIDPNHALCHTALSVVYTRLGKHDLAIEHGKKLCDLEPNDPFSFTSMSVTYMRAGKIPEAERRHGACARMLQQSR